MMKHLAKGYLDHFRRHKGFVLAVIAITGVFLVVNANTMVSDYESIGQPIDWRKPVLYEFTSALAILIMLPGIIATGERWPPRRTSWWRHLPVYLASTIAFSAGHITLMVLMRMAAFPLLFEGSYDFFYRGLGALPYEFWKDARTFVLLFGGFILFGDALKAAAQRSGGLPIELKSGATRILLDPADFLFAKGAANYAEITSGSGESLARITLSELQEKLAAEGVPAVRIHRSYIVNRAAIRTIDPIAGGDMKLTLKDGRTLRASRRYRAELETSQ
ncbi:LytTR family DNA-binding domain-containing protein [Gimibacter soli]|uniref:LytTR family DNA-binding domain-containing protein n=1 Tax=Gimibacter soli TaxID=3024400 RepID=A0AAF0BMF7_9PROT|nr:LytTR family DNA-binding domain-containing protein [Gimibacter soli]WCL54451.1 LytTR family DNA-binding domain-containing protein [Gimibacter soli]